jgi:hypothetical protein
MTKNQRRPPTRKELGLEERFTDEKFRPYALAIGQAALAWNALHEQLGSLFWTVKGGGDVDRRLKKWRSLRNDRFKRDELLALAKEKLNVLSDRDKKTLEEIKWLLNSINGISLELSRHRAIHAPLASTPRTLDVFPDILFGNPCADELKKADVLAEYRRVRDRATLLRNYTGQLAQALCRDRPAWPDRPKLP